MAPGLLAIGRLLRDQGVELIALQVLDQLPKFASYYMGDNANNAKQAKIFATGRQEIVDRIGAQSDAETLASTAHPVHTVTDYVPNVSADCMIFGSQRPDLADFFLRLHRGPHSVLFAVPGAGAAMNPVNTRWLERYVPV